MTTDGARHGAATTPDLPKITRTFARIAALSFGGPAGQIAVMHRILVEEKAWLDERRFLHALNFCMLLPGPEAQQLATYSGWLLSGPRAGLIAGGLFILPGVVALMALSIVYALWGQVGPVAALFFGLKAAVLAIVVQALVRLACRALGSTAMRVLALGAFGAIFAFGAPFPLIVLGAAIIGWLGHRAGVPGIARLADPAAADPVSPDARRGALHAGLAALALWLIPVGLIVLLLPGSVWADLALFFSRMAVVTFGGAYAALAYVAQQAVEVHGWLVPGEMLDGLGMAETTPGPLIMVLQFVGFLAAFREAGALPPLLAGILGGLLTSWVTFAPCFAWIFLGAPWIERLRGNAALAAALGAVTAAVVGVIANLAVWFALHVLFRQVGALRTGPLDMPVPVWSSLDPAAALLSAAALVAVFVFRLGMGTVLAGAAAIGLALHLLA